MFIEIVITLIVLTIVFIILIKTSKKVRKIYIHMLESINILKAKIFLFFGNNKVAKEALLSIIDTKC